MRRVLPLVAVFSLIVVSGCFMDTVLDDKGAGTMKIKIRLTTEAQLEPNRKRFESEHVKVTKATVEKDKWATYELKFDDVTKLNTVQHFTNMTVTLADGEGGTKALAIKNVNKNPNKMPEEMVAYFGKEVRLTITVPGEIVATNASSKAEKTATWTYALNDFTNAPELNLTISYKLAKAAAPAGAGAS